ncbi:hypothetical protein YH65_08220 [Sulfurovum lithotrophicum]|uniref:Uncharacterized protein n=1 Tax=Sulfurovum lithotrophicum TaxID=206403 RepID=A0A7U4M1X6_9BACT|nr:TMEM43 family protein [Sulfurovum lithotrophicum]AKF25374.1 hypothetical protein YH65_08220 [Sulfurovum lithotrophicum]
MKFNFNKNFGSSNSSNSFGNDTFTETTYTSYGQNIGNSFKGIFVGILLLIGSIVLLWWNEGRSVEQATALKEMQEKITKLPEPKFDAALDGKAVLVQGYVKPLSEVVDPQFGVKTDGLLLRRHVEMYQWQENKSTETKDKLGGGTETITTYNYVKVWSSSSIDSTFFKVRENHQNPSMNYKSESFGTDAMLGEFYLDRNMVFRLGASQSYAGLNSMPERIGDAYNKKSYLYIPTQFYVPQTHTGIQMSQVSLNTHSITQTGTQTGMHGPQIGDIKITYTYAPAGEYTYAAKEEGKKLVPYVTENGKSFVFTRNGKVEAVTIFKEELDANSVLTWILRGVGLVLMYIAFTMMMGIIATLAKVIPMLGSLVGGVTSIIAGVLTLILGSIVIALAWFGSRPLLSLAIIGVGVGIAIAMAKFGKKNKATQNSAEAHTAREATPPSGQSSATPPPRKEEREEAQQGEATPPLRSDATPPPRES